MYRQAVKWLSTLVCAALFVLCISNRPMLTAHAEERADDVFSYISGQLRPFGDETEYSYTHYGIGNGLLSSHICAIAQTTDGFIWAAGDSGLFRFNGVNFEQTDPDTSKVHSVSCLCADSRGGLWIGSKEEGISLLRNGTVMHWDTSSGLGSDSIHSIIEAPEGVYAATSAGLVFWDSELHMSSPEDERISGLEVMSMTSDDEGIIYCIAKDRTVFTLKKEKVFAFYSNEDVRKVFRNGLTDILPDQKKGYAYMIAPNSFDIYYCRLGDKIVIEKTYEQRFSSSLNRIYRINSKIMLCTAGGFGVLDETDSYGLLRDLGLDSFDDVRCAVTDHEGNIWLASGHQGVVKISPSRFTYCGEIWDNNPVVYSVCVYDQYLLYTTDSGLCFTTDYDRGPEWVDSALSREDVLGKIGSQRMRDLVVDSKNRLWMCSISDLELLCFNEQEKIEEYSEKNGLISNHVHTVCEMTDGTVVAATEKGISLIRDKKVVKSYGKGAGLEFPDIVTVSEGMNGAIVAGSSEGGIYIIRDDKITNLTKEDELTSNSVIKLKKDRFRDIIWIVTSNSICYLDAEDHIHVVSCLPYTNCYDIIQTESDEMWMLGGTGIYVAAADDLIANKKDIPLRRCTGDGGMPCGASEYSRSFLSSNGDLFIAGSTGPYRIHTTITPNNDFHLLIPYVEADGNRIYPDEKGDFHIDSDTVHIKIYPYLLNYSEMSPEITYCLEGVDAHETTVTRENLGAVDYTRLDGDVYNFSVKIKDSFTGAEKSENVYIFKAKSFWGRPFAQIANVIIPTLTVYLLFIVMLFVYKKWMKKRYGREVEKARVTSELGMAAKIQSGMLPDAKALFGEMKEFELAASMDPAKEVGGDFYDLSLLDPDHLYIVIADVSGKGAPAALFMMSSMITLSSCAERSLSPAQILTKANEKIVANNDENMFVSVWLGILEISTGRLTAASAGHEYPALMEPNGAFALFKDKHGSTLGWMEGTVYKEYELWLKAGSKLFVYTDGVPEATDKNDELFGTDRMIEVLNKAKDKAPDEIMKSVRRAVDEFVGSREQFDDLTMVCLTYKGVENRDEKQHDHRSENERA